MHSNVMYAVGALIEQRTKAQLLRDWEQDQADIARLGGIGNRIVAFLRRIAALRVKPAIGAGRFARA